jgi:hypothetical protein
MNVTLQATRVYGSMSRYGHAARQSPQSEPLVLQDYPARNERAWILLGAPDAVIVRANRIGQALGRISLRTFVGQELADGTDTERLVEQELDAGNGLTSENDYNWYVTIAVERQSDINSEQLRSHRFLWVEPALALRLRNEFASYTLPFLDSLTFYVSTIVGSDFLRIPVVSDHVVFTAEGREPFRLPRFTGTGNASLAVSHPLDTLDMSRFEQTLRLATTRRNRQQLSWTSSVMHWRLEAIQETDPLKRFLWHFFALENMVNKLAPKFRVEVARRLTLVDESTGQPVNGPLPTHELMWEQNRTPLAAKFAVVAMHLSPSSALDDTAIFKQAMNARHNLAHGQVKDPKELPTEATRQLLERYLDTAIRFQLRL